MIGNAGLASSPIAPAQTEETGSFGKHAGNTTQLALGGVCRTRPACDVIATRAGQSPRQRPSGLLAGGCYVRISAISRHFSAMTALQIEGFMRSVRCLAGLATTAIVAANLVGMGEATAQSLEPTYADVLRQPDDPAVNLAYALRLVREGHLNSAAATLERLLLTHPEADDVRVTYMIVLYRLDDMAGAKREADILATRKLSGVVAGEYQRYARQIEARAKPTRFTAYLGSGVRVDNDMSQFTDLSTANKRKRDASYISMAGIGVSHDFASGPIDRAFAQFDAGSTMHARDSDFDLMSGKATAGIEKRFDALVLQVSGFAGGSAVGGDFYSRELGAGASLTWEATDLVRVFADTLYSSQNYRDIPVAENETLHDGGFWRAGGGVILQANEQHQLTLQAHWGEKDARDDAYAYTVRDIEARWLGTFRAGQYVAVSGRYALYDYDGYDAQYDAVRNDRFMRARISYGVPVRSVATLAGIDTNNWFFNFGELVLQTSVDFVRQDSNIPVFDYSSVGAEVLLTRRFVF
jgi:hypothetical protein